MSRPKSDVVLHQTDRVIVTRIGFGLGVRVRLHSAHNGWSIPVEWATRASAIAGHAALAKARPWEGAGHLEAADLLSGRRR